jgi:hypothetical protein
VAIDASVSYRSPATARRMADAANRFLDSLVPTQRSFATFPFPGEERYVWNYRPVERNGLRLINMSADQQDAALLLFDVGLSVRAATQARRIIHLETILREEEKIEHVFNRFVRDPELYYFSIFGQPGTSAPWAWRAGGHHIGLHFTVVDGDLISPLPIFLGANPSKVKYGLEKGSRALPEEEDLARAFVMSLDADGKAVAIVNPIAPPDLFTDAYRQINLPRLGDGLPFSSMSGAHREQIVRLIRHYVERTNPEIAAIQWDRIERAGLEPVTFAWAGPEEPGKGHYYLIKGPTFLIEYDNTQNQSNHIHSVLRDLTNDWGEDLLAQHYAESHGG